MFFDIIKIMEGIKGLSETEALERERSGLYNKPVEAPSKSIGEIIRSNVFTYFNGVFLVLAIILVLVKSYKDLTFLPIIFANAVIGIIQELRAKAVLDKLTVLSTPKARVIRDGEQKSVPVDRIVLGDTIFLKAGDQIPADAEVVSGEVAVNEALLTGEADEIQKKAKAKLMSGSFIVSGECYALVTAVGAEAYAAKLTIQAKTIKTGEQSEIIRSLNKIVKLAGVVIIPVGIIMFVQQFFFKGTSIEASVQAMVAAVIGMIPEGLFLLSSVTLALSSMRLAYRKVLLHDMKSIETLARVDVLCVDKTGTITESEMNVARIETPKKESKELLARFIELQGSDNATMEALKRARMKTPKTEVEIGKVFGFSSKYKYSAAEIGGKAYVLRGAEGHEWQKQGMRVLEFSEYQGKLDGKKLDEAKIKPLGVIGLENRVRETAAETFKYFKKQNVTVKVISGDDPLAVSEVARKAGILTAEKWVDMRKVQDSELEKVAEENAVFGRVTPEQKQKLVKALQAGGHTVAMTGDGVNDVLALKDADCSIAMASGADAAAQAAQMVLLESDFSKMPDVVKEGRRVVNNLERSGSLFLVKNIFSILMIMISMFFGIVYPLVPTQLSFVTLFTIGVPSFLLAQAPREDLIKGKFLSNIIRKAMPGALADVVGVAVMVLIGRQMGMTQGEVGTSVAMIMAVVGLVTIWRVARPMDWYKRAVLWLCVVGFIVTAVFFKNLFSLTFTWSGESVVACVTLALITVPLQMGIEKFSGYLYSKPREV